MATTTAPRFVQSNVDPGDDVIPITKSDTLDVFGNAKKNDQALGGQGSWPSCRGILCGTAGTATITTAAGNKRASVPLQAGYNPIRVHQVWSTGTASDLWAIPD